MGAKRAVAGRSLPYDMLLAAYQKKNQAKQQSESSPRSPPTTPSPPPAWKQELTSVPPPPSATEAALDANAPVEDEDEANNGPVDSDEETAAVMNALARWNPQPVIPQPVFTPIRRQYQLARLHEQMQMATNGGRTNIFAVRGFGAQRMPEPQPQPQLPMMDGEDAEGEPDIMAGFGASTGRPPSMGGTGGSVQGHRQTSVTSRG